MAQIPSEFKGYTKFQNHDGSSHYFSPEGKMFSFEQLVLKTGYHPDKQCADCRDSEREGSLDEEILLVVVTEEGRKGFIKRSYMCGEHRYMYLSDGYKVKAIETGEVF